MPKLQNPQLQKKKTYISNRLKLFICIIYNTEKINETSIKISKKVSLESEFGFFYN